MDRAKLEARIVRAVLPNFYERFQRGEQAAALIRENFQEIQSLAREDPSFQFIDRAHGQFFDVGFIKDLIKLARVMYVKNPIIRRGVKLQGYYAFGRGVEIRSEEPETQKAIEQFLQVNERILSVERLTELEWKQQTDGNLFFVLFSSEVRSEVVVRLVDPLEINEIVTDPEDSETPVLYLRTWSQRKPDGHTETKRLWYPAINVDPAKYAAVDLKGHPLSTDPMFHRKIETIGSSRWAIPEFYAAIDWARAYKRFMEGWSSLQEIYRSLAFQINTPGGQKKVDEIRNTLQSSLSTGYESERNPPPNTGATFVGGPNQKVEAIQTAGKSTGPEEARRLFLMSIMLFAPETFFGDVSVGTLATAKSLDRPTELQYKHAQERWKYTLRTLCQYAVSRSRTSTGGVKSDKTAQVLVSFPPILEHDINEQVKAIISAATLDGKSLAGTIDIRNLAALLLHVVGIERVEEILEAMYPQGSYDPKEWVAMTPEEKQNAVTDLSNRIAKSTNKEAAMVELQMLANKLLEHAQSD